MQKNHSQNNDPETSIDFSMLLASSVHDIKNSLGMLLTSLDDVIHIESDDNPQQRKNYSTLRGEASRINNALIYLLGLYRLDNNQLSLNIAEVYVADFIEEQIASQQLLFDINNITITVDCDPDLTGFFDEHLVSGIINNILVNCAKYTHNAIRIEAKHTNGFLTINIIDDGNGYPQSIIDNLNNKDRSIDFKSGSTNLGLFFSQKIAAIHQCKDKNGSIQLSNIEATSDHPAGGCFTLQLP
jgi:signal transduction histidine kinase